jgi:phage-related tail fiber protein
VWRAALPPTNLTAMRIRLLFVLLVSTASIARAQGQPYDRIGSFRTPSGNIHCDASYDETGRSAELRCDVMNSTAVAVKKPKDCELDYGTAFGLSERGPAEYLCAGDTIINPGNAPLRYGEVWTRSGLRCDVTRVRLRCVNRGGRGFELSTRRQRLI